MPRRRSRSSFMMRLRWANSTSIRPWMCGERSGVERATIPGHQDRKKRVNEKHACHRCERRCVGGESEPAEHRLGCYGGRVQAAAQIHPGRTREGPRGFGSLFLRCHASKRLRLRTSRAPLFRGSHLRCGSASWVSESAMRMRLPSPAHLKRSRPSCPALLVGKPLGPRRVFAAPLAHGDTYHR